MTVQVDMISAGLPAGGEFGHSHPSPASADSRAAEVGAPTCGRSTIARFVLHGCKGRSLAKQPELAAEQAYLDRVYARLASMRERASEQLDDVLLQAGVTPGSVVEREVMAEQTALRLGQL